MFRSIVGLSGLLAVAGCGGHGATSGSAISRASAPTQLEVSVGLTGDEFGRFTLNQLAQIKSLQESDNFDESEKQVRIAFIKKTVMQARH